MKKIFTFMFKRQVLPVVLIVVFAASFIAFRYQTGNEPQSKQQKILTSLSNIIEDEHYSPRKIDDAFSKEMFTKFLETLDFDKVFFLQTDINAFKKYEYKLDDEIHGAELQFLPAVTEVFNKRVNEAQLMAKDWLSKPFEFATEEVAILDAEKLQFAATDAERKERWRLRLKYLTLERYADLLDQREKNKGKADFVVKTDAELEVEARAKVTKLMDKSFDRYKLKFNDDDKFNMFVNTITDMMDPHSSYLAPVDKRYFDEQFSGKFYGIGASLREEDGIIKIASVVTGSPAWKGGEIQVGDVILKVAQGKNEPVDLTGYSVEDAVKLIRGDKATEVRLTVKKPDGAIKVVTIIRDEIVQDEGYVRSAIVKGKNKIGYIYLPDFYADFERPNTLSCAADVAREINHLKEENVEGIVIDLRNNGGGSLSEVVKMVGLFIENGPVVQVKDKDGRVSDWSDRDKSILYDGPLAVMVNEQSASASEIFAAAIQDYKRGVIIGSTSTFGKGTVQRPIPFGKPLDFFSGRTEFGSITLTIQKFYRVNGGSTQLKGVTPDIVIPDQLEYLKFVREKNYPNPLPWDVINKAAYQSFSTSINWADVKAKSDKRISANKAFRLIDDNARWLAQENDKVYNLNLSKYQQDLKRLRETVKQNDNLTRLEQEMKVEGLAVDNYKYNNVDKDKGERYKQWLKNLRSDVYIDEATKIVGDMISGQVNTAKK
jgi:carboxyl-terminal processing protease